MRSIQILSLILAVAFQLRVQAADTAYTEFSDVAFKKPPATTQPWVYWYWLDGSMTRQGITADLEAMKRVGIGGVLVMEVEQGTPPGPVRFLSPEWRELVQFMFSEAARLGIEVSFNNDAGWCGSGGPWISPELSMQKLVFSETQVEGPSAWKGVLPKPPVTAQFYRDIAVLAFPTPEGDEKKMAEFSPKITLSTSSPDFTPEKIMDDDLSTFVSLAMPDKGKNEYIQFEFPQPYTARSLNLTVANWDGSWYNAELQVSDNGTDFRTKQKFVVFPPWLTANFEETTARYYRVVFTNGDPKAKIRITGIALQRGYRIEDIQGKAFFKRVDKVSPPDATVLSAGQTIPTQSVQNLTAQTTDGHLEWNVPKGKWTILRICHTTTGTTNHPSPKEGIGLECDKLSKKAVEVHFAGLLGKLIAENGPLVGPGKTFVGTHIDSWEIGSQNWTPEFREEFKRRRGYDLLPFLPIVTGRVVDSSEVTRRFLYDLRQTVSDLLVENYAGHMRTLSHQKGLRLAIEAYYQCPTDDMAYAGQADEPWGEFWAWEKFHGENDVTEMASAAHIYGKRIVGAEAFTSDDREKWLAHPYQIKELGDWAFCEGVNRIAFHRYAMQPWMNRAPGMGFGPWGVHYERTQTWWELSRPWHEYIARCQFMLQQGLFSADIAYLQPEGAPAKFIPPDDSKSAPRRRNGYNFDGCNADALMTRASVKDGRITMPDGMNYRVLVLPDVDTMTPPLLQKIKSLVADGATVIGRRPLKSPSLSGYPDCDAQIKQLADELWGDCDGQKIKERTFGKGRIVCGMTPQEALAKIKVPPDFEPAARLRYIHRIVGDTDAYFVANPESREVDIDATFRVSGKIPELWYPDSGRIEEARAFSIVDGRTIVPLHFDPSGSVFVVFRKATTETKRVASHSPAIKIAQELSGLWEVNFTPQWGAPEKLTFDKLISWSQHPDSGVKYFSGTATYIQKFKVATVVAERNKPWYLDLGKVAVMAEVKLNGKDLGILWKPPFRVEVTDAIQAGENIVEIKVANLWINRLIGDEQLPEDSERNPNGTLKKWPEWVLSGKPSPSDRFTFATHRLWKKGDPLQESGLLGPVTLRKTE